MSKPFKDEHPFEKRKEVADKIKRKFPDRIPVIVEKALNTNVPDITKRKFIVPGEITLGSFSYEIRKHLAIEPATTIFIFINSNLPPAGSLMSQLYERHRDTDGFLYLVYSGEGVFG